MENEKRYKEFIELDKAASLGGGLSKIEKQHEACKINARERIELMLEKG